jgi:thymidylate kinase
MIRRINLYGGPGTRKSTQAAFIYARLKGKKCRVELVQEFVKTWAYENREPSSFDQLYLFARQVRMEDIVLRNGIEYVITDSPIGLSICYSQAYGFVQWPALTTLAQEFERKYPSLNLFFDRAGTEYEEHGRFQKEADAMKIDKVILAYLESNQLPYHVVNCTDIDTIMSMVDNAIDGDEKDEIGTVLLPEPKGPSTII